MSIQINHIAVAAVDKTQSATFLASLLDLPEPTGWGPFLSVRLPDGFQFDFAEPPMHGAPIQGQHYALLVDDAVFDRAIERLDAGGVTYWPDPQQSVEGEINHNHGGRGVYFDDPAGHHFELITAAYGSDL
ncbi:MAG: VOC family protein [Solirubrobacteraceae bacterium]|nr:VOC family protein [Patulibacter sp.]